MLAPMTGLPLARVSNRRWANGVKHHGRRIDAGSNPAVSTNHRSCSEKTETKIMSKEDRTQERIGYVLSGTGWATLSIRADAGLIAVAVSYLHDSLGDLARMGLDLAKGAKSAAAVFMDEPGEVHVVVTGDDDDMAFELRRYRDWASWGITAMDDYEVLDHGGIDRIDLIRNIHSILERIYVDMGLDKYRELWVEHEFPLRTYEGLIAVLKKRLRVSQK